MIKSVYQQGENIQINYSQTVKQMYKIKFPFFHLFYILNVIRLKINFIQNMNNFFF